MTSTRSFKQKLSKVYQCWQAEQYDDALGHLEALLEVWPGNPQLHVLWATLVQLQDNPSNGLDEVKARLQSAIELDRNSPSAAIELGYFLDAVEDNPQAAAKSFSDGISMARRLLVDGLLGKARSLLQLGKRDEAFKCLMESLRTENVEATSEGGKSTNATPDILLREPSGTLLAFQLKGPFAIKIEDLLREFSPKRSA